MTTVEVIGCCVLVAILTLPTIIRAWRDREDD